MKEPITIDEISYWKRINTEIPEILGKCHDVVCLLHDSISFIEISDMINRVPNISKLLYVSLNKTYDSIHLLTGIVKPKMLILDCVSSQLFDKEPTEDCVFVSYPESISELMKYIMSAAKQIRPQMIIIDSISQLKIEGYDGQRKFAAFIQELRDYARINSCLIVIMHDENYLDNTMITDLVSEIIKMEVKLK